MLKHINSSDTLQILNRNRPLFKEDITKVESQISEIVNESSFLVIGGGGSIGRSVSKEIFKRRAKTLHIVDLNENNLVELVRYIRSEFGYITKDFDTFSIDCGDEDFAHFMNINNYDYVLNLSAMKHVRNENSIFSMKRMIETNIINSIKTYQIACSNECKKYFSVSTDKAANPVNFMGATKRIMEHAIFGNGGDCPVSMARFANVAFSDGSLLAGFCNRLLLQHPITAPSNIKRFFLTEEEAGIVCLLSTLFGKNGEIAIPIANEELALEGFEKIISNFLSFYGFEPFFCQSEEEARNWFKVNSETKKWPVYLFESNTTGEKPFEEFITKEEKMSTGSFSDLGFIKFESKFTTKQVDLFIKDLLDIDFSEPHSRKKLLKKTESFLGNFDHVEKNSFLNSRM